jgi:hypothetical protein
MTALYMGRLCSIDDIPASEFERCETCKNPECSLCRECERLYCERCSPGHTCEAATNA